MDKKKLTQKTSWFWKWFLNSQVVVALIIVLLLLLIALVFTKVSYLFEPVGQFFAIVGLPMVIAGILYYLMNPVVNFLERKGLKRTFTSMIGPVTIAMKTTGTIAKKEPK